MSSHSDYSFLSDTQLRFCLPSLNANYGGHGTLNAQGLHSTKMNAITANANVHACQLSHVMRRHNITTSHKCGMLQTLSF